MTHRNYLAAADVVQYLSDHDGATYAELYAAFGGKDAPAETGLDERLRYLLGKLKEERVIIFRGKFILSPAEVIEATDSRPDPVVTPSSA